MKTCKQCNYCRLDKKIENFLCYVNPPEVLSVLNHNGHSIYEEIEYHRPKVELDDCGCRFFKNLEE